MSESQNRVAAVVSGAVLLLFAAVGFGWLLTAEGQVHDVAAVTQAR